MITEEFEKLYIIILNYLSYTDTIALVRNLKQQNNISLEIVIVDNASPNNSSSMLHKTFDTEKSIVVLDSGKNGGYSYGNNFGLRYIEKFNPKYVAILNNDIELKDKQLLSKLIVELKSNNNIYSCAPTMHINGKRANDSWKVPSIYMSILTTTRLGKKAFNRFLRYPYSSNQKNVFVECIPGSFMLFDYPKFKSLDFFDDRVFLFDEETILGYKIKQRGGVNLLCRQYSFDHNSSKTINASLSIIKGTRILLNSRVFFHKYYTKSPLFLIWILQVMVFFRIIEEFAISKYEALKY